MGRQPSVCGGVSTTVNAKLNDFTSISQPRDLVFRRDKVNTHWWDKACVTTGQDIEAMIPMLLGGLGFRSPGLAVLGNGAPGM